MFLDLGVGLGFQYESRQGLGSRQFFGYNSGKKGLEELYWFCSLYGSLKGLEQGLFLGSKYFGVYQEVFSFYCVLQICGYFFRIVGMFSSWLYLVGFGSWEGFLGEGVCTGSYFYLGMGWWFRWGLGFIFGFVFGYYWII